MSGMYPFKILLSLSFFSLFFLNSNAQYIDWSASETIANQEYGNYYPRITANEDGVFFITWGGRDSVYFTTLANGQLSAIKKINTDSTSAFVANWTGADIAVKDSLVYVAYMHKTWGKKTYLQVSKNFGNSFGEPVLIENYADSTSRFPTIAIDEQGNPLVAIMKMTKNGEHPHYVVRKSSDQGKSFSSESLASNWSGSRAESCDCCPASLKVKDSTAILMYRDNLNNVRDIWASISLDGGQRFNDGYAIDNNQWRISACPSSGPDGVILNNQLISVFLSGTRCYVSNSKLGDPDSLQINILGGEGRVTQQNFPRIDQDEGNIAMIWQEIGNGYRLMCGLWNPQSRSMITMDTLLNEFFYSADVAVYGNQVYVVWADNPSGTIRLIKGDILISDVPDVSESKNVKLFPNPTTQFLNLPLHSKWSSLDVINSQGVLIDKVSPGKKTFNVSHYAPGTYYVLLQSSSGETETLKFIKN